MKIKFLLTGTTPLLPQSDRLVNPLDELTKDLKRLTSKRKMTDDDHYQKGRLEWIGALYYDPQIGPYIPSENIGASVRDGGKLTKYGTAIERALLMEPTHAPILYRGPREREALWADESFRFSKSVVMSGRRVMRTRPIFREWALEAEGELLEDVLDFDVLQKVAQDAGQLVGIGTYRRGGYGRYDAAVEKL